MIKYLFLLFILLTDLLKIHSQTIDSGGIYLQKSYTFQKRGITDSALFYGRKALVFSKKNRNDSLRIQSILQIITLTDHLKENDSLTREIHLISAENKDKNLLKRLYFAKANNYFATKNFDLAVAYYLKVDSLSKRQNKLDEIDVKSIYKRARISKSTFTHDGVELAHDLSLEALKKAQEILNEPLIYRIKLLLSEILFLKDQPDEALKVLKECENYFRKANDYNLMSRVFLLKALYFKNEVKDYKKTDSVFKSSIDYYKQTNYDKELADLYIFYGDFLKDILKNNPKALHQYILADSIYYAKHPNINLHYVYLLEGLSEAYEKAGDYKKALFYDKSAYEARKELYKKQNRELSRRLEVKFQANRKQQQIALLNREKKNERNMLLGGLTLIGLTSLFLFFAYKNNRKTAQKLKELNTAKSLFFTNISHEFRTPLTLISGITQVLKKNKSLTDEDKQNITILEKNSNRLLELVNQLLDAAKLETGAVKLQKTFFSPKQIVCVLCDSFVYRAKEKNIKFHQNFSCDKQVFMDKEILKKIISNLLSNAFKYTPENGEISCNLTCQNNKLQIEIINTGEGLTPDELKKIFFRFYQKDHTSSGVGIGLSLVKSLVDLHQGKINVKSQPGKQTTFRIEIPIEKTKEIDDKEICAEIISGNFINKTENELHATKKTDKPVILIVEDNPEVANLIASVFQDDFVTVKASDGKEGTEKAFEILPHLIISDIMMPVTDGTELCRILKNDKRTAHIPIILLTAKSGDENKIAGIKTGADDYITKPFNIEILKEKVRNLIKLKQRIRDFYRQYDALNVKNTPIKGVEESFLQRIEEVLKEHLTQSDFNVENFAKAIGISRMQLHRRIKEITGMTTSEFIRIQRLKLAAFLLQQSDTDIAQVGYTVGFNSPSYFNKCFKEMYQCTPREYVKRYKK